MGTGGRAGARRGNGAMGNGAAEGRVRLTVAGLFDDNLDAEQALLALRKAERAPEQISLVVRDRVAEGDSAVERTGAVARALVATALDAVGGWLQGLASLIVPERGTYLVAGPLGAALAGAGPQPGTAAELGADPPGPATADPAGLGSAGLLRTLTEFGFADDEADYLEHRLAAGAALIAVTSGLPDQIQGSRRLFASHNAVHIGLARTSDRLAAEATAALSAAPRTAASGEIVVADAVAPLRRLCRDRFLAEPPGACGAEVLDRDGTAAGSVIEVFADPFRSGADGEPVVRYVVVGFGGLLGLGRHHAAVPAALAALAALPVRLTVARAVLEDAPQFDPSLAFSRREEQAICAYFGTAPYWSEDEAVVG